MVSGTAVSLPESPETVPMNEFSGDEAMVEAARKLRDAVDGLQFAAPVAQVYNPLAYAWEAHVQYLRRYAKRPKKVIFLGMNPGPFGMVQTAVPFGEIASVRDWLGISSGVNRPAREHPRRPIQGFACTRSEVSGRRLWGLFREKFGAADAFFRDHFVANYCPLAFLEASGKNYTPARLPERAARGLERGCDEHLREIVTILRPEWLVGVGTFARQRAEAALADTRVRVGQILHPSPASPAANRGWAEQAENQLRELKVW